jgi:glycyl-tRNA synthetase alpha subunit
LSNRLKKIFYFQLRIRSNKNVLQKLITESILSIELENRINEIRDKFNFREERKEINYYANQRDLFIIMQEDIHEK